MKIGCLAEEKKESDSGRMWTISVWGNYLLLACRLQGRDCPCPGDKHFL